MQATDRTATTRFLQEARLAASLSHPNIVVVHEYFEHDGIPYMAMEVLPRGSLRPLVGSLELAHALGVLDGILAGLVHACEHRIVHRDLKPENVMRADDGTVKIADFGIALAQDELAAVHVTPEGEFVGSPAYVSPEQVHGAAATAASDLYAVGVIAFELLTGEVPFAGSTPTQLLMQKIDRKAPSVRSMRPDLDGDLAKWVDRLLERNPERRPSDPADVRDALEAIAERAVGPRWRRDGILPAEFSAREPAPPPTPPHRFTSLTSLRRRGGLDSRAVYALKRPLTLGVVLALVAAAVLLDARLFVVAAVAYAALAAITFFDEAEMPPASE
jgi:serine/threonine protein kinase